MSGHSWTDDTKYPFCSKFKADGSSEVGKYQHAFFVQYIFHQS